MAIISFYGLSNLLKKKLDFISFLDGDVSEVSYKEVSEVLDTSRAIVKSQDILSPITKENIDINSLVNLFIKQLEMIKNLLKE